MEYQSIQVEADGAIATVWLNRPEVRNAVDQVGKEIGTRFDFKGTSAHVELVDKGKALLLYADSDFQLGQVRDVLLARFSKRGVDARFLDLTAKPEKIGGDKLKQPVAVKAGIDSDTARKIQQLVKHPLTDKGLEGFLNDWKKSGRS